MINEEIVSEGIVTTAGAVSAEVGNNVGKKVSKSKRPKRVWTGEVAKNIVVEQYTSTIRRPKKQAVQVRSLGLGRIGKRKVLPAIPPIVALVEKLKHLVRIVAKD
jgi:large subunit ribosomal protein L30